MRFRQKIANVSALVWTQLFLKVAFGRIGHASRIIKPMKLDGVKNIFIGSKVIIERHSWLAAMPLTGFSTKLIINDGAAIGHFAHIYATNNIEIGSNVLIADKVYISDNLHGYENIHLPIINQSIKQLNVVIIGDNSWIGENVCVIGASIGEHCVIGANSVVTKDIPAYSVAVGAPAKIIKRYNFNNNQWQKTNAAGEFI